MSYIVHHDCSVFLLTLSYNVPHILCLFCAEFKEIAHIKVLQKPLAVGDNFVWFQRVLNLLQVEIESMATKEKYMFVCDRWLADDEDDHSIVRELPAKGPGIKRPLPG